MITAKELLLRQMADAFRGRPDMPLMAALDGVTEAEATWTPNAMTPTIEQIVRHVAWAKLRYCQQAFGTAMVLVDPDVNDDGDTASLPWEFPCGAAWGATLAPGIAGAIRLLEQSHGVLT